MLKVNAKTKLFGVLADPIDHVRAPDIYNEKWIYNAKNQLMIPIHVKQENLMSTIDGLRSLSNFYGFCVTIPHKVDVARYCDMLMPNAEMIGAVNVAYFNKKRELIGNNFDGDGFISGLKAQGYNVKGKRIFLAGAGGASRAIAFSLAKNNVSSMSPVILIVSECSPNFKASVPQLFGSIPGELIEFSSDASYKPEISVSVCSKSMTFQSLMMCV